MPDQSTASKASVASDIQHSDQHQTSELDELSVLRARVRNGFTVICERCNDSITLATSMESEVAQHLLRVAIELRWMLSRETALALGAQVAPDCDRDLCPTCRKLFDSVPAKSR